MRRHVFAIILLCLPTALLADEQSQSVLFVGDGKEATVSGPKSSFSIVGPAEIEPKRYAFYQVEGLSPELLPHASILYFPRNGVQTIPGMSWGGGSPYILFFAEKSNKYLLRVTVDHPPKTEANGLSSSCVHVKDEVAEIVIQVGDPPPPPDPPDLSIDDAEVGEDGGEADLQIILSKPAPADVSFRVETKDGDATVGQDYKGLNEEGTIREGLSFFHVSVPIINDDESEGDESFQVVVSDVRNATPVKPTATVTILDDDAPDVTKLAGVIVYDVEDESQQDYDWYTIMYGERFNKMVGDDYWQPVDIDAQGSPPWIKLMIARVLDEEKPLAQPQLFLYDWPRREEEPNHGVVWNGPLSKDIDTVEKQVREWLP